MKKYGAVIALGLAVLFGVLAVVLANRWLTQQAPEEKVVLQERVPLTKIVIAAQDISIGSRLNANNLTLAEWPKANVPKGAFEAIESVENRVAITPLSAGEPLQKAEVAAEGSGAGLVALIPEGFRAMSIRVDEVIGVAGFILPNTYVDVIGVESNRGQQNAETIMRRIKVLAIAQETMTEEGKAKVVRTVTLQIKPKEAERLALQTHKGSVHLVLRNPLEEDEPEPEPEPVVKKVAKRTRSVPTVRPRVYSPSPTPHNVEILRGTSRDTITFENVESETRLK